MAQSHKIFLPKRGKILKAHFIIQVVISRSRVIGKLLLISVERGERSLYLLGQVGLFPVSVQWFLIMCTICV